MREASPSVNCCGRFAQVIVPDPQEVGTDLAIEEGGAIAMTTGASSVHVDFMIPKISDQYEPIELYVTNSVDDVDVQIALEPTMVNPTIDGCDIELNGFTDTDNYILHWRVRVY